MLKRYYHVKSIGEGAFATVQLYTLIDSGIKVAIKQLKRAHYNNTDYVHRFCREIAILQELEGHSNIIRILDHSMTPDLYAYVMPLANTNLQKYINLKNNSLELKHRLGIFERVLRAIEYAHSRGVLHRDISPNNVLMFDNQKKLEVRVSDFGLGKLVKSTSDFTNSSVASYGHFYYVAPEQREKLKEANFQSDVYSLGKVLDFILTGKFPDTVHQTDFSTIVRKATFPDLHDRYLSVRELRDHYLTVKNLVFSTALPIRIELAKAVASRNFDWPRIHESMMFVYKEEDVYKDFFEPILGLFSDFAMLKDYCQTLGAATGDFARRFVEKLTELPKVKWPYASTDDIANFLTQMYILASENSIRFDCLTGLWYLGYERGFYGPQEALRDLLDVQSVPESIQGDFADFILQSSISKGKKAVPLEDLVKLGIPSIIRNAVIVKSGR